MKFTKVQKTLMVMVASSFLFSGCDFKKSDPMTLLEMVNPPPQGLGNGGDTSGEETPQEPILAPEEQLITFAHLQKTSLVSCKDCHSKTSNPNKKPLLITIDHYKARLDAVISEISTGSMPPVDDGYLPLTDCEKAMLEKWIELGTPETTNVKVYDLAVCNPNPPIEPPIEVPPPATEPPAIQPPVVEPPVVVEPSPVEPSPVTEEQLVTFDYLVKTAFVSCAECHTVTKNPKKKPLLTNLEDYKARIVDVVTEIQNDDMPDTELGAMLLTACEKAMVYKWVDAGTPAETTIKVSEIPECAANKNLLGIFQTE